MRMHSPSMSELHAFAAVVRLGSFSRAAQELCVTQGAISRAVSRLETHFGRPLLRRDAHRLWLTAAGNQLLEAVKEPLQIIEAVSATLRESALNEPISLAVVPTFAAVWLVPKLKMFQDIYPQVQLRFIPYRKDEDFRGDTPHAAILTGLGPQQWPGLDCSYVIGREVVPVCHPGRLSQRRKAGQWCRPEDLASEPLLFHTTAPGNWAQWLQQVGGKQITPNLAQGFDQVSILVRAVIADMGVALVQKCLVRQEIASGQLAVPFAPPVMLERGYFLCVPNNRRMPPGFHAFKTWLLETAAADIKSLTDAFAE